MSDAEPRYEVDLDASEVVATRGHRRVSWLVEDGKRWIEASSFPGARVEMLERSAGTVSRRHIVLRLPEGCQLQRVESAPRVSQVADPVNYLQVSQRSKLIIRRSFFRVGRDGRLLRIQPDVPSSPRGG